MAGASVHRHVTTPYHLAIHLNAGANAHLVVVSLASVNASSLPI